MLPGMQTNSCGTSWFVRNRDEELFAVLGPCDSMLDERPEAQVDTVHLSDPAAEEAPPMPTEVHPRKFVGRDPFKPPVNPGQKIIKAARTLEGRKTYTLVGQLKGLRGTPNGNKMCADYVTSMLDKGGTLNGHYVNVDQMQKAMAKQGWKRIPASQARPGDVAVTNNGNHTELVAENGGKSLIGSNNMGQVAQTIHEHKQDPSQAIYWGRR